MLRALLLQVTGDSHRGIGDSGVGLSAIGFCFLRQIPERPEPELPTAVAVTRHQKIKPQPIIRSPVSL
jgi:hypothetical protein